MYEVIESDRYPGHWHAENILDDGSCEVAVFSGPHAQTRAEQYAKWMNAE